MDFKDIRENIEESVMKIRGLMKSNDLQGARNLYDDTEKSLSDLSSIIENNTQSKAVQRLTLEVAQLSKSFAFAGSGGTSKAQGPNLSGSGHTATYTLQLKNGYSGLDLRNERAAIEEVISYIANGGSDGTKFQDLSGITLKNIASRTILIEVAESGKKWHVAVGQRLANNHGMRKYCNPKNPEQMFEWSVE